jgi:diadenosine tetraphosphate (Ap4A) HIT family hydrolase
MACVTLSPVLKTDRFNVTPCIDCDVPGYLIIEPRESSSGLLGLELETQRELGTTLAKLETALIKVTGAERVYLLRFSEGLASIHFHVFPRSFEMAESWKAEQPQASTLGINGPLLFAWARIRYHVDSPSRLSQTTLDIAARVRKELDSLKG